LSFRFTIFVINSRRLSGNKPYDGAIAHLKPAKATLFIIIFYNPENNIRDIRPFCHPLFCYSSVVKYTSSLLQ